MLSCAEIADDIMAGSSAMRQSKTILAAIRVYERGQTIWTDGHRGDGKRLVVRADEKLTTFLELESGGSPLYQVTRQDARG